MEISVVIPVKDEAENIGPLTEEICAALDGAYAYEIIYVDDGSRDATPAALQAARHRIGPHLRALRHARGCGQSTAVWNGVCAARAPVIATLDGDGQNDPADIPALVRRLLDRTTPADLVIGHRTLRSDSRVRIVSSRIANGIRRRMLKDDTPDTGCGIKAFRREKFLALPYFDHMHRFLPALVQRQGGSVVSLPVRHRPRLRGASKYGIHNRLWIGIVDLFGVAWLLRREQRVCEAHEQEFSAPTAPRAKRA